ncbi:MAG: NYN domain-containing protein [Chloroflexota bacterium]
MRVNVYVDGFNLYFGLKRYERQGKLYKWLDLEALSRHELPNDTVHRVRYFTALVQPRPGNPQQGVRQQTYLRALQTIPNLSIDYGIFLTSVVTMMRHNPPPGRSPMVQVIKTEEKGSDVNIATRLLCDAYEQDFEMAVIISNDSDLVMPIEVVRRQLKKPVGVLNPNERFSNALKRAATFYRPIGEQGLASCQFPPTLQDATGTISKPPSW